MLLKYLLLSLYQLYKYYLPRKVESVEFFYHYKMILGLTNKFLLAIMGCLFFTKVFVIRNLSGTYQLVKFSY